MNRLASPRDAVLLRQGENVLVTAVDSCGGIGALPGDLLKTDGEIPGLFTARVALMEVLALGAQPLFYTLAAACPPAAAEELLRGARRVLYELPMTMSTEKNFAVSVTAFGITVTGQCAASSLRNGGARAGDSLYLAGLPLVGAQVLAPGAPLLTPEHLKALLSDPRVRAVLPVGSQGVAREAEVLAAESGLSAELCECGVNLACSGGPSSCAVFAAQAGEYSLDIPVQKVGRLL